MSSFTRHADGNWIWPLDRPVNWEQFVISPLAFNGVFSQLAGRGQRIINGNFIWRVEINETTGGIWRELEAVLTTMVWENKGIYLPDFNRCSIKGNLSGVTGVANLKDAANTYASAIGINGNVAGGLCVGDLFQLNGNLHVVTEDSSTSIVKIAPPLRKQVPVGTPLVFKDRNGNGSVARGLFDIAGDSNPAWEINQRAGDTAFVRVSFVERI